jgi:dTDP-4-amino-4,6-dideoxygalactose transaminase
MFYVLMPDRPTRDAVLQGMREHDISPTFHYVPLHSSEAGRKFSASYAECPVSDDISGRLIRLPFYNNLTEAESQRVIESFVTVLSAARVA